MSLTIHQSGIDAAINAQASGFDGVTLNRVDLYNGSRKIKSLSMKGVDVIEQSRIYVVAQDSGSDRYDVTKIEFYTSTNVKFATAQNDDNSVIQSKAANSTLLLAHQLNISSAPGTVVPSGDVSLYAPQATEATLGTAEIATQAEVNSGSDHSRMVTPKTLWSLLTRKFARIDVIPTFSGGIDTNGHPVFWNRNNNDYIRYNDTENQPGTYHLVADGSSQTDIGNANLKLGGIQLASGNRVTSISDATGSSSATTLANSRAVKTAMDRANLARSEGTRQATTSTRGQAEIATQTEVTNGTDNLRIVTPKTLKARLRAFSRIATETYKGFVEIATQAEVNAGADHSRAVTPKTLKQRLASFATKREAHFVGQIVYSSKETPEPGFFALDGSTIPNGKIDYPELASSGSRWITVSGNNIVLKDAVDFIRGQGSSGRAVGAYQGDEFKRHDHNLQDHAVVTETGSGFVGGISSSGNAYLYRTSFSGGEETRPKSLTALICIYHGVI